MGRRSPRRMWPAGSRARAASPLIALGYVACRATPPSPSRSSSRVGPRRYRRQAADGRAGPPRRRSGRAPAPKSRHAGAQRPGPGSRRPDRPYIGPSPVRRRSDLIDRTLCVSPLSWTAPESPQSSADRRAARATASSRLRGAARGAAGRRQPGASRRCAERGGDVAVTSSSFDGFDHQRRVRPQPRPRWAGTFRAYTR